MEFLFKLTFWTFIIPFIPYVSGIIAIYCIIFLFVIKISQTYFNFFQNIEISFNAILMYSYGAILAFLACILLYYATHIESDFSSYHKKDIILLEFYFRYFKKFCIILCWVFLTIVIFHHYLQNTITKYLCMMISGYQIILLFLVFIPDSILDKVFHALQIHDLAVIFFESHYPFDIQQNLIYKPYQAYSFFTFLCFLGGNSLIFWLHRLIKTTPPKNPDGQSHAI